jgi:hypothetical protein
LAFFAVLFWAVQGNSGILPFSLAAALLPIFGGKHFPTAQFFAVAVQAVGFLILVFCHKFRWTASLYTIGLLGCAGFFPFCAAKKCAARRSVLITVFFHGAYLCALLLHPPLGAINYRTVLILASFTVFWETFSAFGERSLWCQLSAIFHVSLAAIFAVFLFLPSQRPCGILCLVSLLLSASLMATLLPGDGPIYERDLKGLMARNPPRAALLAITVLFICLFPAVPLLAYCLPILTVLRLALPTFAICLCLAVLLSMAIRTAVILSLFSERPGIPELCNEMDRSALSLCLLQLVSAVIFALSGAHFPTF